jgi:hypothetical protein
MHKHGRCKLMVLRAQCRQSKIRTTSPAGRWSAMLLWCEKEGAWNIRVVEGGVWNKVATPCEGPSVVAACCVLVVIS